MDLVELFCDIDDFCIHFEPLWNQQLIDKGEKKLNRKSTMALSEVMTIIIEFHRASYRNFKHFYKKYVMTHLSWAFPRLVSYNRFVELMPTALIPMCHYLNTKKGTVTGISPDASIIS